MVRPSCQVDLHDAIQAETPQGAEGIEVVVQAIAVQVEQIEQQPAP
jgi:hypothetical protein